ncbi:hypothetical protein SNE40_015144 [Patella caerulea]|uniref:G-protein coupled receptors family 1 profile domain-containing protein n=1 Tax=Patella caerulea TaxID=87958 RepID=A0AAN8JJB6_PATCE
MDTEIYMSVFTILNYESIPNASHYIMAYIFPVIAGLAILGNTLFVVSILSDNLRQKTTGILLASSNISSIVFTMASLGIVYYPWIFTETTETFGSSCNLLVFAYHALATWSVHLLSCACVERYIAICHPMSKYAITSKSVIRQSLEMLLGTFIGSMILNGPMLWFSGLTVLEEMPSYGNLTFCYYFKDNWYMCIHEYIELAFYSVLPFFVISFCNIAILRKTYFQKNLMRSFEEDDGRFKSIIFSRKRRPQRSSTFKLATILLPISFLHLIFSLIVVIAIILEAVVTKEPCDKLLLLTVSYNAAQLQAGYHFYVNIAVSKVFRIIFRKLFQCSKVCKYDTNC